MTSERDALLALADRVEREAPSGSLDREVALASGKYVEDRLRQPGMVASAAEPRAFHYSVPTYTTSVDAALSLLPEGWWEANAAGDATVVNPDLADGSGNNTTTKATAATPAQALLAAILRAKAGE